MKTCGILQCTPIRLLKGLELLHIYNYLFSFPRGVRPYMPCHPHQTNTYCRLTKASTAPTNFPLLPQTDIVPNLLPTCDNPFACMLYFMLHGLSTHLKPSDSYCDIKSDCLKSTNVPISQNLLKSESFLSCV